MDKLCKNRVSLFQFSFLIINKVNNFFFKNPTNRISKNIILPVNLTKVNWQTLKKVSLDNVSTKVMDLNPKSFGTLFIEPFTDNCDGLWRHLLYP